MNKIMLSMALFVGLNLIAADATNLKNDKKVECETILKTGDTELIVQRGCCSHHQGVCGCNNGRDKCCDGTLSPSCTCNSIVPVEELAGAKI